MEEVTKTTKPNGLEAAAKFLNQVASPTVEEMGLMYGEDEKYYRLKNQIENLTRVKKLVEENNMTLKQVNLKVLFPYLEGIALEEDNVLQDMWAKLFVNYIDSKSNLTITVYPNILKQLSSKEVEMILMMYNKKTTGYDSLDNCIKRSDTISSEINNLVRLGILTDIVKAGYLSNSPTNLIFELTEFAYDFVDACTIKKS